MKTHLFSTYQGTTKCKGDDETPDDETSVDRNVDSKDIKQGATSMIDEKLFEARTVLLSDTITPKSATRCVEQLLALSATCDDPIHLIVNSPGGHVESGDMIHDIVKFIPSRVKVIGAGWVASAATTVFLAADKKDRFSLPNTRYMLHQPSGGAGGPAVDIAIQAREIVKIRERINSLISKETGQSLDQVSKDTDRDYWMTATEAKSYGIVGSIITKASDI